MPDQSTTTGTEPITKAPSANADANESRGRAATRDVRGRIDQQLKNQFDDFLMYGTPEEKWFLWDVLCTQQNSHRVYEDSFEMGIASAFEECISQRGQYVRVPEEELVPRVVQFIKEETEFAHLVRGWRAEHAEPVREGR